MSRPVCKFFQQGTCRYGESCRFEHPRNTSGSTQNRFAALGGRSSRGNDDRKDNSFSISTADVRNDMTAGKGRPQWLLSTYGPGRGPPASLLEGNEYSFEELRARYYELASANNLAQADQECIALWTKAEETMKLVANNADDVIKYMEEAEKKHPNRIDFCQADGTKSRDEVAKEVESKNSSGGTSGFGAGGSFGQPSKPSSFGPQKMTQAAGFGQSGFGQPAQPVASANPFAQPSAANALGKQAFGQPGGFGLPSQPTSAFGQPSQPISSFGQPAQASGFGQTGFGQKASANPFAAPSAANGFGGTGFGQTASANPFAAPSAASGFGQPSQPAPNGFGQPSQPAPAFGQPAQPSGFSQASPFAQPAQSAAISEFGQPTHPASVGFGQTSQPATGGFGQPSQPASTGFGQKSSSGFGSAPAPANQFSQSHASKSANPFGVKSASASPFGQPAQATGGFGQPPSTIENSSGFGKAPAATAPAATGFGLIQSSSSSTHPLTKKPSIALTYTETLPNHTSTIDPQSKRITSYAGRRVQYIKDKPCYERPDGKGWERIWFPAGPEGTDVVALKQSEKKGDLERNEEEYTETVREAFGTLFVDGAFRGGLPSLPPMIEWCDFDF